MNLVHRFFSLILFVIVSIFALSYFSSTRANNEDLFDEEFNRLSNDLNRLKKIVEQENKDIARLKGKFAASSYVNNEVNLPKGPWKKPIPVIVFVCKRADALDVQLQKLLKYRSSKESFPIYVSQDCDDPSIPEVLKRYQGQVEYIKHESSAHAHLTVPPNHSRYKTYYQIARHYKLGLDYIFNKQSYDSVIILEDDLDVSPDIFSYFSATRWLLEEDETLFCVSAWNDNGKASYINLGESNLIYRSDFFPGLGWMTTKMLWTELGPQWPTGFWDDWIRDPTRRKGRQCIRPEISRTAMTEFGRKGASQGLFFNYYLKRIVLNNNTVDFANMDLSPFLNNRYKKDFLAKVYSAKKVVDITKFLSIVEKGGEYRVEYKDMVQYTDIAKTLKIMGDTKAGVPRTAYEGIVPVFTRGKRLYIAPARVPFTGYDTKWEAPPDILSPVDTAD